MTLLKFSSRACSCVAVESCKSAKAGGAIVLGAGYSLLDARKERWSLVSLLPHGWRTWKDACPLEMIGPMTGTCEHWVQCCKNVCFGRHRHVSSAANLTLVQGAATWLSCLKTHG